MPLFSPLNPGVDTPIEVDTGVYGDRAVLEKDGGAFGSRNGADPGPGHRAGRNWLRRRASASGPIPPAAFRDPDHGLDHHLP